MLRGHSRAHYFWICAMSQDPSVAPRPLAAVVLAAGKGTRMKSDMHKVLHPIGGRPMILHLFATLEELGADRTVLVVGAGKEQVTEALPHAVVAEQTEQLGTGHAVMMTRELLHDFVGDVLVLYGDVPLIPASVMQAMVDARHLDANTGIVVLGFRPDDPARYGRLVLGADSGLDRIVEYKGASENERAITLCNSGMMLIDGARLFGWLDRLTNQNAAGEYYLTDLVALARSDGARVAVEEADPDHVMGVNSRAELAAAEAAFQRRTRKTMLDAGVSMTAPETVFFSHDTKIGADTHIEPHVVFGPGVHIAGGATIKAFSHLEGASIGADASVGPYARLRPGAKIGASAKIGNFVEVKNADISTGAKVSHLSYIGDAFVGTEANIGAGTITCNYDGFLKHKTHIGSGAFVGSNTALVAPVEVGDGAIIGAGSTITTHVAENAVATTRAPQKSREGAAEKLRARGRAAKAAKSRV